MSGESSGFFDFESRDRPENTPNRTDSTYPVVGFFQNRNALKSSTFTFIYLILSILLWHHTYQANDVIFDRTFRSMHVIPKSMVNHASGYWTFDWLTHPFRAVDGMTGKTSVQNGNVVSALCMHDIDECFEWKSTTEFPTVKSECVTSSATQKKGKFSCAMTRNQTRYAAGLYNSHCASLPTKFEKVACQMQRSADVDVVVNDDKSYSMSSGHSKAVLMFYVTVILFVVNLFNFFESSYWMHSEDGMMGSNFNYSKAEDVKSLKKYVAIFIFVLLVLHRGFYATEAQKMGIEAPMPNGTFFYGLLAYTAVTWFLSFHEVNDGHNTSFSNRNVPDSRSPMEMQPLNKPMELNLAGFEGKKKLRTDAFTQPGNVPNLKRVTDGDADLDLGDVSLEDYAVRPSNSVWAMVNLWVWPLIILSAFITKSNYQLDIELTVVLVGFFFIGLIELFTKRLMELKYLFGQIQEKNGVNKNASLSYGVPLVVLISMVVQITTLAVVFWTANWSFGKSGYEDSGVFTIGDPEKSKRREYIVLVKTTYLVYFIAVQVYKLSVNLTFYGKTWKTGGTGGESKRHWYMTMDGWLFSLMNLMVLIIVGSFLQQAGLDGNDIGYYDAGVYLKAVASQISWPIA